MKIAISATGPNLDATVDPRFGRCEYFIIYDTDTNNYESIKNQASADTGGAGVRAAQIIKDKGVEVVLTGNIGPNAVSVLSAANIGVSVGVTGTVKQAIEKFLTGEYPLTSQANVAPHFGFRDE